MSVDMVVTKKFVYQGEPVFPGDVIRSPSAESVYLRLADLAEVATGEPSPAVDQVDAAAWLADYGRQIVELEHKFMVVKGFLPGPV